MSNVSNTCGPAKTMSRSNFKQRKNRATKIHVVFDEEKRREFLTGFHKRKLERRRLAKEKFDKDLKDERKRLKQEAKNSYKNLVVSHRAVPEVEHLLKDEYEDRNVKVTIVDVSNSAQETWIGSNMPKYAESEGESSTTENPESDEEMPGMELKRKTKPVAAKLPSVARKFSNEKEVKLALKKQAAKNVKKSKVFQMQNRLEKQKQKKKAMKQRLKREKVQAKAGRHRNSKRNVFLKK